MNLRKLKEIVRLIIIQPTHIHIQGYDIKYVCPFFQMSYSITSEFIFLKHQHHVKYILNIITHQNLALDQLKTVM